MRKASMRARVKSFFDVNKFRCLNCNVIELNDINELKKVFGWTADAVFIDDPTYLQFRFTEDVNNRRLRDAESLGTVVRNAKPKVCLEIGTGRGLSSALIAVNAPGSVVHTINILPEEFNEGGTLTSMALSKGEIGSYYRGRDFQNIRQIYANTASWTPDIGMIDVAFIDGCHDADFVVNDTLKVLDCVQTGAFLVWHDFNPKLAMKYSWIYSVCEGLEELYRKGKLKGRMFHLRDSWTGIYCVGDS
ncbi:class I SAM-dependent methyltransferase [Verrucomicrobiota bacterium]